MAAPLLAELSDPVPRLGPELSGQTGVRFVKEDTRADEIVQFTEPDGPRGRQGFKELHGGRDDNRGVPQRGQVAGIRVVVLRLMMDRRDDGFRVFAGEYQAPSVNINGLVDDVGEWKDH